LRGISLNLLAEGVQLSTLGVPRFRHLGVRALAELIDLSLSLGG
jgi:hypothetical protein